MFLSEVISLADIERHPFPQVCSYWEPRLQHYESIYVFHMSHLFMPMINPHGGYKGSDYETVF